MLGILFAFMVVVGYMLEQHKRLAVIFLMSIWAWFIFGCSSMEINKNSGERTMSRIVFYNDFNFTMPAAPGSELTTLALTPQGQYFGILSPVISSPGIAPSNIGCSNESNVKITKYRYSFIGPKGLRPAVDNSVSGLYVSLLRSPEWSIFAGDVYLPFVSTDWEETSQFLKIVDGQVPLMAPTFNLSRVDVDTRNLQDIYYETNAILRLEVECSCAVDL